MTDDLHARGPVAQGGAPWSRAGLAMILLHGRGGGARDMLALAEHLALPDIACLAPDAAGNSWWPQSFLAPIAANEPALSSALAAVGRVAEDLYQRLERIRLPSSPFAERLSADTARQVRYAKPQLVAEVEFRGWTGDQNLRHASFHGLREDKGAAEIVREAAGVGTTPPPRTS